MAKQVVPGKYKGGAKQWEQDRTALVARRERSLVEWQAPDALHDPSAIAAIAEVHKDLGLAYAWEGNTDRARAHFQAALDRVLIYLDHLLPELTSKRATNIVGSIHLGAIAAALVGADEQARMLLEHTQRFPGALVTDEEEKPVAPSASMDVMGVLPLTRAYSLIRLGRLSGFHALRFLDPPPPGRRVGSVWGIPWWRPIAWEPADIDGLITTAETCWRLGKSWRGEDFASERGLFPLLRALAVSLQTPDGKQECATAQAALADYVGMIRNMADFLTIYLLVLDLQRAYPQIFKPVTPGAL